MINLDDLHILEIRFNDNPKSNDVKDCAIPYGMNYFKRLDDLKNIVKQVYGVSSDGQTTMYYPVYY